MRLSVSIVTCPYIINKVILKTAYNYYSTIVTTIINISNMGSYKCSYDSYHCIHNKKVSWEWVAENIINCVSTGKSIIDHDTRRKRHVSMLLSQGHTQQHVHMHGRYIVHGMHMPCTHVNVCTLLI